ncbi:MAG: UDP-N-acetylmuramate dehydrogenase [Pseudomonadales bacterium]
MLREWVDLKAYNTLALHARAAFFCEAHNISELQDALALAQEKTLPVLPLGEGSNIVFTQDYQGMVLRFRDETVVVEHEDDASVLICVGAGLRWHEWVEKSLAAGWYGLENLALIPGTVGAAPIQNIGAYGVEVAAYIDAVRGVYLESGKTFELDNEACRFAYRNSVFKERLSGKVVITSVVFRLTKSAQIRSHYAALHEYLTEHHAQAMADEKLDAVMIKDAVCAVRRSRLPDPSVLPNVGSFFKNPQISPEHFMRLRERFPSVVFYTGEQGKFKIAAGWLIDQLGWKGRCMGAACVHDKQALVLVNQSGATGQEIMALANAIASDVLREFGIALECEPLVL